VTWALWTGHRTDVNQRASDRREAREDVIEEADRCVNAWEVRESARDAVERAANAGARAAGEALIAVVAPDGDAAVVEAYRQQIEQQTAVEVGAARAEIPDPECDREAALATLERARLPQLVDGGGHTRGLTSSEGITAYTCHSPR
jgi:isopentenyl diphosphate isomerase/L-lactate dehydrogenase-like FMN-dependent dehydrogenase